jgi:hypothetical protein
VFEIAEARAALRLAVRGADLIETFAVGELRQELELIGVSA